MRPPAEKESRCVQQPAGTKLKEGWDEDREREKGGGVWGRKGVRSRKMR